MNDNARTLMKQINEASFAMDDVVLYLDTHLDDKNALSYFHYVKGLREKAMRAYEAAYGPLFAESADSAEQWTWLTDRWPWEGEV